MKPSGAGFVGHVHMRSSSTFCATATHGPPRRELATILSCRISPVVEGGAQPRITWPVAGCQIRENYKHLK